MKMSENVSPKYYWENKERLQIKAREKDQILSKEEKEKKAIIWSWTLQKSLRRWRTKDWWLWKKYYRMRKNTLLKESILI